MTEKCCPECAGVSIPGGVKGCMGPNCECHKKQEHSPEKEGWEEELDENYEQWKDWPLSKLAIKDFIRTLIASERTEAKQRGRDEAVARIKAAEWVFVNQGVVCNKFSRTSFLAVCEEARTHKGTKKDNH